MAQLLPHLSTAGPSASAATRGSTATLSQPKDSSKPSPFDSHLRDIAKPKPAAAKPVAKPAAKPVAKKTAKAKVESKPDAKTAAPKKTPDHHEDDSSEAEQQDNSDGSPQDQSAQDDATSSDKDTKSDHSADDNNNNHTDAAATHAKAAKVKQAALPAAQDDPTIDDSQDPASPDNKPTKKGAADQNVDPTQQALAAAIANQAQTPAIKSPSTPTTSDGSDQPTKVVKAVGNDAKRQQASNAANAAALALPDATTDTDAASDDSGVSAASSSTGDSAPKTKAASDVMDKMAFAQALASQQTQHPQAEATTKTAAAEQPKTPASQQAQFNELNHPNIVSTIQGKLLPDGGAMNLTLNPPDLGEMNVRVEVHNGVLSASFSAERDQTAKLLSHSLGDLKSSLESQGITVAKLNVTQTPKDSSSNNQQQPDSKNGSQSQQRADADQKEQQRREMLQRMWRKLMKGSDPLDLLA